MHTLIELQEYGEVVVGSTSIGQERELVDEFKAAGCHVVTEYVEEIERYYQASNFYVFPTTDAENSIQISLSVLEARACNKQVFTTRFGGLANLFEEGNGLISLNLFLRIRLRLRINQSIRERSSRIILGNRSLRM